MANKAVIMGANQYLGLSVTRCLGANGIHVVIAINEGFEYTEDYGFYSKYVKERIFIPFYGEKDKRKLIVEKLIEYGKNQSLKPVLIPTADPYVEIIDEYVEELKEFYLLPDLPKGFYNRLIDKDKLANECTKHNVLIPKTIEWEETDNVLYDRIIEELGFPCIIKPVNSFEFSGVFKTKMFIVNNREELIGSIDKAKAHDQKVFAQQLIHGFDDQMFTFDCYIDKNGKMTHWLTCQKQRQLPINFGSSTCVKQRYIKEIVEIGEKFLLDVGYRGFAEIEFKKNTKDGKFYLIEINVRVTNFNALLNHMGINIPLILYKDLIGEEIGEKKIKEDLGVYFIYGYEDVIAIYKYLRTGQLRVKPIIKAIFKKKVFSIWDWSDLKPALRALKIHVKKLLKLKIEPKVYKP